MTRDMASSCDLRHLPSLWSITILRNINIPGKLLDILEAQGTDGQEALLIHISTDQV